MKIAFVIFDEFTSLDFIGAYDPITRLKTMDFLPDLEWDICSFNDTITDGTGLIFTPTKVREPLTKYDLVIIPGGIGTTSLINNSQFINWIKTSGTCKVKASVCTGSLILGAAGFLRGKKATTHPNYFGELKKYCKVIDKRVVDDGNIITSRGVSSSLELGLYLCEKLSNYEAKEIIRKQMDYQHQ
ncbi:DJ-1/PfpI family protein [Fredinandcohnia humi]